MLIQYAKIDPSEVGAALNPDSVGDVIGSNWDKFLDFVDDNNILTARNGKDISVVQDAYIFIAKDKSTMVRGFQAAAQSTINCSYGTVVYMKGRYGTDREGGGRRAVFAHFSTTVAFVAMLKMKKKTGVWASTTGTRHMLIANKLQDRGYYVVVVGRRAFNAPPQGASVTFMNDYRTTFGQVASRIHGA